MAGGATVAVTTEGLGRGGAVLKKGAGGPKSATFKGQLAWWADIGTQTAPLPPRNVPPLASHRVGMQKPGAYPPSKGPKKAPELASCSPWQPVSWAGQPARSSYAILSLSDHWLSTSIAALPPPRGAGVLGGPAGGLPRRGGPYVWRLRPHGPHPDRREVRAEVVLPAGRRPPRGRRWPAPCRPAVRTAKGLGPEHHSLRRL